MPQNFLYISVLVVELKEFGKLLLAVAATIQESERRGNFSIKGINVLSNLRTGPTAILCIVNNRRGKESVLC